MCQLTERYRPKTFDEVIGQDAIIQQIKGLIARGDLAGQSYMITGKSGQGKTTIARLIAAEIADQDFIQEFDGKEVTTALIREIEADLNYTAWGKGGKAIVVNECHKLSSGSMTQLLVTLERIPKHAVWIFTTTVDGEIKLFEDMDAGPFCSRSIQFDLSQRGIAEPFAKAGYEIAVKEGLNGEGSWEERRKAYMELVNGCRANFRAVLKAIQAGQMMKGVSA